MLDAPEKKPSDSKATGLKSTLNLPQTPFPMKANLPVNEPLRLKQWQEQDLYGQIRAARAGAPKYILHDGPPYANGAIHLGHALNKCIKDFIVKTKTMAGFDAPYVPGWDCHGLPIEIKVDEQLGRKKLEMDPLAVRKACREYAQKYVNLQRTQFERIGVFGRWDDPYLTMSNQYESKIVESFYSFFEQGFVYKGLKPVFWCIHDRTALAEAEVEYEQHTSPSVYIRYKLADISEHLANYTNLTRLMNTVDNQFGTLGLSRPIFAVIWTTTPWTIPASQALAFNADLKYVAVAAIKADEQVPSIYIMAEALKESVLLICKLTEVATSNSFKGSVMEGAMFCHPLSTKSYLSGKLQESVAFTRTVFGVIGDYVTADQGTGVVHTAPAHGVDDFYTGINNLLTPIQYVDNAGKQRNTGVEAFEGLTVFKSNAPITELLRERGALLAATHFEHSYPHCWRCHNPVIVRATEQWFIGMETPMQNEDGTATTYRQRALDEIDKVVWDPAWGKERISNMIATRPDWCISRQRIWGVPIAVFLCEKCGEPLKSPAVNRHIVSLFERESADAWYRYSAEELLLEGTACACGHTGFRKEMDILDVWFESGSSWHAVLEPDATLAFPADLYTEGGDQHRGWFHSSLLTSVAMRNNAPYKMVATSGWTLDEQGRAFSKSLGNGVDPVDIAKRLGGEIVRLWVASVDFREDVAASENLMQRVSDNYRKLRNTLRFLLSNLYDFVPAEHEVKFEAMQPLDQYILARLAEVDKKIRAAYDDFEFHRAYHALNEFTNTDLSALYLDVLKDRLYTFAPNHPGRRSAQTALWHIVEALTRLIAPILSFTADEVWALLPKVEGREAGVHLALFTTLDKQLSSGGPEFLSDWTQILNVRQDVLQAMEPARKEKMIGKSTEARVFYLPTGPSASKKLVSVTRVNAELEELFGVSEFSLLELESDGADYIFGANNRTISSQLEGYESRIDHASGQKCERCWRYTSDVSEDSDYPTVCLRCAEALHALSYPAYEKVVEASV